jgi:peptidyl-prolyl cis-trans isomerase D
MLTTIRSKSSSLVVKILFALLIVAFALWGIGDIFRGDRTQKPVAEVGSAQYTQAEFRNDLKNAINRFSQSQGVQVTAQQFAQLGGVSQVISRAINTKLLESFARKQHIGVSQETVVAEIQADPEFKNAQGQFDRSRFEVALDRNNLSEAGYVELVRSSLISRSVYSAMVSGVEAPQALTKEIYLQTQQQRTADVLLVPVAAMTGVADPDDATLQKYLKDHADQYKAPEYRAATVLQASPEDIAGEIPVGDDEIAQEYAAQKAQFSTPETHEVEQVVVQDQATADKIEQAIKGGTDYKDAVKQITGGDPVSLGKTTKDKLPKEIADQVFAVPAGGTSAPLTSPFGIHIVHVLSIQPGSTKTLDEVKGQLKHQIALGKAGDALDSIIKQLDDTLAGGASLEEAANKLKLKLKKLDAVDETGKDAKGQDTGLSPDALKLVFSTDSGNLSPVTPLADGSYAVVQVSGITPPADRPFDQVKAQVKADWLAEARKKAAEAKANEIAEKIKAGGDLNAAAAELGQTVKHSASFTRAKGDPANLIDTTFAQAIFDAKLGQPAVGDSKDGPVVAKVTAITPPDPAAHPNDVDNMSKQILGQIRNDLAEQFGAALQQEIKPVIHEDVVDSLLQE